MAIAFVKDAHSATDVLTVPAGGFAAGNLIVMGGFWDTTDTISSIGDTSGVNIYASAVENAGNTERGVLWWSVLTNSLTAGQSITAVVPSNDGIWIAAEFSGIAAASALDRTQNSSDATTVSHTSGATLTTTQADELLVGLHVCDNASNTFVATGSWIQNEQNVEFGTLVISMQYQIVSATSTYESTADSTPGGVSANNLIATFKAAAAPPADTGLAWIRA